MVRSLALILMVGTSIDAIAQGVQPVAEPGALTAFIDCQECSSDTQQYLRSELTYIDFVRNRQDAAVHALVTTQDTGSGGEEWSVAFLGQGDFAGIEDTVKFATEPSATEEQTRALLLHTLRLGFVRYIARTDKASKLVVTFAGAPTTRVAETKDRWNSWVMSLSANGFANGEESRRFLNVYGNVGADRITERWKITTGLRYSTSRNRFALSDGVVTSSRNDRGGSTVIVRSLGQHWSVGGFAEANTSSYSNVDLGASVSPAVEYNFFPYSESTRRQLRFLYNFGPRFTRYDQITVFEKTRETLWRQSLEVTLDQKTKWGSTRASIYAHSHVPELKSNSLSFSAELNWRIARGLSVRTYGNYSRVRDQRSIPLQAATDEAILLQLSQLRSGYRYFVSFGLSYSFGATTNNVVNPRFGR